MGIRSASRVPVRRLTAGAALVLAMSAAMSGVAVAAPVDITVPLTPAVRVAAVDEPVANAPYGTDVEVAYGGSLTVQFPALGKPGPDTVFQLWFSDSYPSTWTSGFGTSGSNVAPLAVTDVGNDSFRIDIPTLARVGGSPAPHSAYLQVDGLSSPLPQDHEGPQNGLHARLAVTTPGPTSAALASHLALNSALPTVSVGTGGTVRLHLPTSSALYRAGLTSLRSAAITVHHANAGNLSEDWGPAEPITTSVAVNGLSATVQLPANMKDGRYALQVKADRPQLFIATAFLLDVSAPDPAPASTAAAPPAPATEPATSSAPESAAQPEPGTPAAAPALQPDLQVASSGHTWIAWTGIGTALILAAGGAVFLVRRRTSSH